MRLNKPTAVIAVGIATLLLASAAGCQSKKTLDKHVDALVEALQKDDYARFKKMSHKGLVEQFSPQKFRALSKAINSLGSFEERTMKGIQVKTGGLRQGQYVLRFAKGKVRLRLTLKQGKLNGFRFEGETLKKAMRKVANAKYGVFKVGEFQWRDAAGRPRSSNVFKPGEPIKFAMAVWGLKVAAGKMQLKVSLEVVSGGATILKKPEFINGPIALPAGKPPVARVTGNLKIPRPGSYLLKLRIVDRVGNRRLLRVQSFNVGGV